MHSDTYRTRQPHYTPSRSHSPSSSFPFSLHSLPCDDVSEKMLDDESMEPSSDIVGHMASSAVVMMQSCIGIEDIMVRDGGGDGRPGRT